VCALVPSKSLSFAARGRETKCGGGGGKKKELIGVPGQLIAHFCTCGGEKKILQRKGKRGRTVLILGGSSPLPLSSDPRNTDRLRDRGIPPLLFGGGPIKKKRGGIYPVIFL